MCAQHAHADVRFLGWDFCEYKTVGCPHFAIQYNKGSCYRCSQGRKPPAPVPPRRDHDFQLGSDTVPPKGNVSPPPCDSAPVFDSSNSQSSSISASTPTVFVPFWHEYKWRLRRKLRTHAADPSPYSQKDVLPIERLGPVFLWPSGSQLREDVLSIERPWPRFLQRPVVRDPGTQCDGGRGWQEVGACFE